MSRESAHSTSNQGEAPAGYGVVRTMLGNFPLAWAGLETVARSPFGKLCVRDFLVQAGIEIFLGNHIVQIIAARGVGSHAVKHQCDMFVVGEGAQAGAVSTEGSEC